MCSCTTMKMCTCMHTHTFSVYEKRTREEGLNYIVIQYFIFIILLFQPVLLRSADLHQFTWRTVTCVDVQRMVTLKFALWKNVGMKLLNCFIWRDMVSNTPSKKQTFKFRLWVLVTASKNIWPILNQKIVFTTFAFCFLLCKVKVFSGNQRLGGFQC